MELGRASSLFLWLVFIKRGNCSSVLAGYVLACEFFSSCLEDKYFICVIICTLSSGQRKGSSRCDQSTAVEW